MLSSMFQLYIKGSNEAIKFYQKAFNANLVSEHKNDDGSYLHAELNAFGDILAISEITDEINSGNTMQFCFHFDKEEIQTVKKAYEILKDEADILIPIGPCFYSSCMFALIDKFGNNWCLFV